VICSDDTASARIRAVLKTSRFARGTLDTEWQLELAERAIAELRSDFEFDGAQGLLAEATTLVADAYDARGERNGSLETVSDARDQLTSFESREVADLILDRVERRTREVSGEAERVMVDALDVAERIRRKTDLDDSLRIRESLCAYTSVVSSAHRLGGDIASQFGQLAIRGASTLPDCQELRVHARFQHWAGLFGSEFDTDPALSVKRLGVYRAWVPLAATQRNYLIDGFARAEILHLQRDSSAARTEFEKVLDRTAEVLPRKASAAREILKRRQLI